MVVQNRESCERSKAPSINKLRVLTMPLWLMHAVVKLTIYYHRCTDIYCLTGYV